MEQLASFNGNEPDSSLGRARSMTKTLEQKAKSSVAPTNALSHDLSQIVNELKVAQSEWRQHSLTRKVPIFTLQHLDTAEFERHDVATQMSTLKAEREQLNTTIASLFREMQQLKQQNQNMAQRVETLRKVLHESKNYAMALKQKNDTLAEDIDFQSSLHEKQRRVWRTKLMQHSHAAVMMPSSSANPSMVANASVSLQFTLSNHQHLVPHHQQQQQPLPPASHLHNMPSSSSSPSLALATSYEVENLSEVLHEYEITIERQRETIKLQSEQMERAKAVAHYERNQQVSELQKEIQRLRQQRQQEVQELTFQVEQRNADLNRAQQEHARLVKTLEVTTNEANANRKLVEASRPLNGSQTEQQLFRLEHDYLTLSEVVSTAQHRLTHSENECHERQLALDEANRMIREQSESLRQLQQTIQVLTASLAESKVDQSDLISALQNEWENCKQDVRRYKEKCRRLQHDKDELAAAKLNTNMSAPTTDNDAELVVLVDDLRQKLTQKENEVMSQEMLMRQLMDQQKMFQKRNKQLVARLKQSKRHSAIDSSLGGGGGGGSVALAGHQGFSQPQPQGPGHFSHYSDSQSQNHHPYMHMAIPEHITVEMKTLYEHYLRNPMLRSTEMLHEIRVRSQHIASSSSVGAASSPSSRFELLLPDVAHVRVNTSEAVLRVIEEILVQRQNAIDSERRATQKLVELRQHLEAETQKSVREQQRLQSTLAQYTRQIDAVEEEWLLRSAATTSHDALVADITRLSKENGRIADEFLHGVHQWNAEKAILSAERAHIETDVAHISHNLQEIVTERRALEAEADQAWTLYANLVSHLREQGVHVQLESMAATSAAIVAASLSSENLLQRRKRTTLRLKLYQTNTSPASEPDNEVEDSRSKHHGDAQGRAPPHHPHDPQQHENGIVNPTNEIAGTHVQSVASVPDDVHVDSGDDAEADGDGVDIGAGEGDADGDEADAYIPFDEPDEFNLLDREYHKQAMDFISVKDEFLTESIADDVALYGDVNLMAQNVLNRELIDKEAELPTLKGWMEKKSPTFGRGWQKRWVIVRGYNIFYGKQQCDIEDTKNESQRKKFLNAIPLLVVQYVVATDISRTGKKFEIVARDPRTGDRRHYQWKATTRQQCEQWIHGLNAHKKLLAARLQFLANTGQLVTN